MVAFCYAITVGSHAASHFLFMATKNEVTIAAHISAEEKLVLSVDLRSGLRKGRDRKRVGEGRGVGEEGLSCG